MEITTYRRGAQLSPLPHLTERTIASLLMTVQDILVRMVVIEPSDAELDRLARTVEALDPPRLRAELRRRRSGAVEGWRPVRTIIATQNPYRDLPVSLLLTEREVLTWDLVEIETDLAADSSSWAYPVESVKFLRVKRDLIEEELARRERLRQRPGAPAWPTTWPDRRAEIDEVKAALPLDVFIEAMFHASLERRGREYVTHCFLPGHDDTTPSFTVSPDKGLWYCHGCHRGGDLIALVEHYLGVGFLDALDILKDEAGIARGAQEATPQPPRQPHRPPATRKVRMTIG